MIQISYIGLNFEHLSLSRLGEIRFDQQKYESLTKELSKHRLKSLGCIKTCNRAGMLIEGCAHNALDLYKLLFKSDDPLIYSKLDVFHGEAAVKKMFSLASGMESKLIGDLEIVAQFRGSFQIAKQNGALSGNLERLVNFCIEASREVRSRTDLSSGSTTLSFSPIQILRDLSFPKNQSILVLGLGEMGEGCAKKLHQVFKSKNLNLANRNEDLSRNVAQELDAQYLSLSEALDRLGDFDCVVNTIDGQYIQKELTEFPSILIDLASKPAFHWSKQSKPDNFKYFDLENASNLLESSIRRRKFSIPQAQGIIDKHFELFRRWSLARENADQIKYHNQEIRKAFGVCPVLKSFDKKTRAELIKDSMKSFVDKISNSSIESNE